MAHANGVDAKQPVLPTFENDRLGFGDDRVDQPATRWCPDMNRTIFAGNCPEVLVARHQNGRAWEVVVPDERAAFRGCDMRWILNLNRIPSLEDDIVAGLDGVLGIAL